MKPSRLVLLPVCAFLLTLGALAQNAPNPDHGSSPSGKIDWKIVPAKDSGGNFTVANHEPPEKPHVVTAVINTYTFKPYFSPNERWLITEDGGSSLGVALTLFKRAGGTKFVQVKPLDIFDATLKAAKAVADEKKLSFLDHIYLHCTGWSPDGKRVFYDFNGKGASNGQRIEVNGLKFELAVPSLQVTAVK